VPPVPWRDEPYGVVGTHLKLNRQMDTSLNDQSIALTSADSAAGSEYAADAAGTGEERTCGVACGAWINWRKGSLDNRAAWKATCSVLLLGISGWYFSLVADSTALVVIGACWAAKLLVEIWGQHTPTWAAPGTVPLFVAVYVFGLPSFVYVYGGCRSGPQVEIPHRDAAGLVLYFFGSSYSLWYEINRFRWKSLPQNKGRLHTIGLARHSIHPNYFGDLFTYTGWGLATGTQCALSMAPMSLFCERQTHPRNRHTYTLARFDAVPHAIASRNASQSFCSSQI
jgi:hypothetical protein